MRSGKVKGLVTGAIVGATAAGIISMMDRGTKQRISRYAAKSAKKFANMASDILGKS